MDDYISRQAALDALCDNCETFHAMRPHYPCKIYTTIEKLPQVEGEVVNKMIGLISKQDTLNAVSEYALTHTDLDADKLNGLVKVIMKLPSADVQPRKTAEWIYGEKNGADGWYCSKCGFHIPWYYEYYGLNNINFIRDFHTCPHCDSKMMKYTGMEREQNG